MKVIYFGEIADITKKTSEEVAQIKSVASLTAFLKTTYNINEEDMHIAVNFRLVDKNAGLTIEPSDEIAVLSPFAGG